mmetsp:Transcript_7337/g.10666  ORF Transcript_7337/g.10666 Transcript_7337/m.10666 type:complete len:95 (+) Transcript_7337:43-327(+)
MNEPNQDEHTTGVAPSAPLTSAINLFTDDGIPEDVETKKNRSSCTPNSSERRRSSAKQSQSIASRASGLLPWRRNSLASNDSASERVTGNFWTR